MSSNYIGPTQDPEEQKKRQIAAALLAPRGISGANDSASSPVDLGSMTPSSSSVGGSLDDSAKGPIDFSKLAVGSGQAPAPELARVAPQLLNPQSLGSTNTAGQSQTRSARWDAKLEKATQDSKEADAAAGSYNPFGRSSRIERATLARQRVHDLMAIHGQASSTEMQAPLTQAHAGYYQAETGLRQAQAGRTAGMPYYPPKDYQDTTGKWSRAITGPAGTSVQDLGITSPLDVRKQVNAQGMAIVGYEPDGTPQYDYVGPDYSSSGFNRSTGEAPGRVAVKQAAPPPKPNVAGGGIPHMNAIVQGYNTQYQVNGPDAASAYLKRFGVTEEQLLGYIKGPWQPGAIAGPSAAPAAAPASSAPAAVAPPPGKKIVGRFNPETGRIE